MHHINHNSFFLLLIFLLTTIKPDPTIASEELVFSAIDSANQKTSEIVISDIYKRAGLIIKVKYLPGKRALKSSTHGVYDGELSRINLPPEESLKLVKIPYPISYIEPILIYNQHGKYLDGDLDLSGYRVGVRRGVKFSELMTSSLDVVFVTSNQQLLKMLQRNRIDVAIISKANFMKESSNNDTSDLKQSSIHLEKIPLYHYLHEKNSNLAHTLNKIMKEMQTCGELNKLIEKAILDTAY